MTEKKAPREINMPKIPTLTERMLAVSKAIARIKKDKKNKDKGYDYASEKTIKEAFHAELNENGVLFGLEVVGREVLGSVLYIDVIASFTNVDNPEDILVKKFMGTGNTRDEKGYYAAITGAIKYVLTSNFLIPTGDDPEDDKFDRPTKKPPATTPVAPATPPPPPPPPPSTEPLSGISESQIKLVRIQFQELWKIMSEADPIKYVFKDDEKRRSTRKLLISFVTDKRIDEVEKLQRQEVDPLLKRIEVAKKKYQRIIDDNRMEAESAETHKEDTLPADKDFEEALDLPPEPPVQEKPQEKRTGTIQDEETGEIVAYECQKCGVRIPERTAMMSQKVRGEGVILCTKHQTNVNAK